MTHTTPSKISGRIRYLRDLIAPGSEIVRVPVTGEMRANYCFPNIQTKVRKAGGEMVIGWCVWESSIGWIEAEYHAVWKKDDQLTDITAKADGEREIVFIVDAKATYIPVETSPDVYDRLEVNRILPRGESRLYKNDGGRLVPISSHEPA